MFPTLTEMETEQERLDLEAIDQMMAAGEKLTVEALLAKAANGSQPSGGTGTMTPVRIAVVSAHSPKS